MRWIANLFAGGGVRHVAEAATSIGGMFGVHKERQAVRDGAYRQAALGQYAAEFQPQAYRTWFDSLVDGLNRLIRPVLTITLVSAIPVALVSPQSVDLAFAALASLPDAYWMVLSLVLGFYFGGRMQLKAQDFRRAETTWGAVQAAAASPRPQSTPRALPEFVKPQREVSRVFLHCTASDHPHHDNMETLRDWHVRGNGWSDVGYHELITFNGDILAGRSLERIPAAQKGHNRGTIAIALSGGQNGQSVAFTAAQLETLRRRCQQINEAYGRAVTFHGHKEVAPGRACPVYDYQTILGLDGEGRLK